MSERKLVYDPLHSLMAHYQGKKESVVAIDKASLTVEERLAQRIIDGDQIGLDDDLAEAMKSYAPLHIINTFLLDGMKVVGELFGSGQMQLPFVLQSAETMKRAVAWLEPYMEKTDETAKGTMVLATVKGDVHDIGKNLVDIILTNNGYKVVNLGIKVPVEQMLEAATTNGADAIGMSGLLVKSTLVMKENLQIMRDREIAIPVVLGGAALTRRYVEQDLREIYGDRLAYAEDAFDGLRFMERLKDGRPLVDDLPADAASGAATAADARRRAQERDEVSVRLAVDAAEIAALAELPGADRSVLEGAGVDEIIVAFADGRVIGGGRIARVDDGIYALEGITMIPEQTKSGAVLDLVRSMIAEARGKHQEAYVVMLADAADRRRLMLYRTIGFDQVPLDDERARLVGALLADYRSKHESDPALLFAKEGIGLAQSAASAGTTATTDAPARSDVARDVAIPRPPFWGSRVVENVPLEKIFEYLNEVALIRGQWGVRKGTRTSEEYKRELDETVYPKLEELKLVAKRERLLEPRLIYGYFPAKSNGNALIVYKPKGIEGDALYDEWSLATDGSLSMDALEEWQRFDFPRQADGRHLCISDFFRAVDEEGFDVLPVQIVTVGRKASDFTRMLFEENRYSDYLYFHGLSVETAEALAEYWHRAIRIELGIADQDAADIRKLFSQGYRGSRYSFGYPACPSLEDQRQIFVLLRPERIDIELTDEFMLDPEQSTSAIVVHHPEAKYFNVE